MKPTMMENDSVITKTKPPTPDTHSENLHEQYKVGSKYNILRQPFYPEIVQETQNQHRTTSLPQETQTEHPNQQYTSRTQTDNEAMSKLPKPLFCASSGKQPFLDNDVFNLV